MQFWSPQLRKDIDTIERVQHRATRLIPGRARLSYEERLKETGLSTLERRWLRGDMMEMFKIIKGRDKISEDDLFNRVDSDRTRGHSQCDHSLAFFFHKILAIRCSPWHFGCL